MEVNPINGVILLSYELNCLVYPAKFSGRSTDMVDEFLDNKYDALILTRAAWIYSPELDRYPLMIDFIIQKERDVSCTYTGHYTMTSIRKHASKRYSPNRIREKFEGSVLESIIEQKTEFLEGNPVWLKQCIIVRAQASDDRYCAAPGEFQHLYITGVRRTMRWV